MSSWLETMRRRRLAALGTGVGLLLGMLVLRGLLAPDRDPFIDAIRRRGYPATLAELDAWYPYVPPAENAALVYTNAFGLLTNSTGPITNLTSGTWLPPIGQGLSPQERSELKAVLAQNQAALHLLHSAPASGRSRYPIHLQDGPETLLPHLGTLKRAVSLVAAEAFLHATDGDAEKSTQAFLVAGQVAESVSEEPIIISQLVRYASWNILLTRLERALSVAPFTDTHLASLEEIVETAERPRAMARAAAGGQATHLSLYTDRKIMKRAFKDTLGFTGHAGPFLATAFVSLLRVTGLLAKDRAFYCETMGKDIAALELPYPARLAAVQQMAAITNTPSRFYFSRMLLPALDKANNRDASHVALVRVAAAALAVERFRLAHGKALPESLEQLVPAYCQAVPTDPFDGKPLRYKTRGGSYAVYSIGNDGQDNGGVVWDSNYLKVPQDVGFVVKH